MQLKAAMGCDQDRHRHQAHLDEAYRVWCNGAEAELVELAAMPSAGMGHRGSPPKLC